MKRSISRHPSCSTLVPRSHIRITLAKHSNLINIAHFDTQLVREFSQRISIPQELCQCRSDLGLEDKRREASKVAYID
jgi:hypothetical protein